MKYYRGFLSLLLGLMTLTPAHASTDIYLRDKIGQMLLMGFDGKQIDAQSSIVKNIQKNNLGGVILFDYNYQRKNFDKNIENPTQVKKLNHNLQYFNSQGHILHHRLQLPLLIAVDYEGGRVNRLNEKYGFQPTMSAALVGKKGPKIAELMAETMARQLEKAEFNLNFAPVVDLNTNPNNPVIGKIERSFSSNPKVVIRSADIYSRHLLQHHLQCAYKHFPGHGSSTNDSHLGFVDITHTWKSNELKPYQALLNSKNACGVVMTGHLVNRKLDSTGVPATLSHQMLTGVLRQQLHYQGVIITDDMQMKAISDRYGLEKAVVLAINAGADMLVFGNNLSVTPQDPKQLIDLIESKVLSGEIKAERINEAYQHILALKQPLTLPQALRS